MVATTASSTTTAAIRKHATMTKTRVELRKKSYFKHKLKENGDGFVPDIFCRWQNILILILCCCCCCVRQTNGLLMDSSAITIESIGGRDSSSGSDSQNGGLIMDSISVTSGGGGSMSSGASSAASGGSRIYLDKIGNLEKSIAAVFNKVAYGSTTTKRSIPDNVFVPSLTTEPTPSLTTFRYREREKDLLDDKSTINQYQQQPQLNNYHRNYELDLERDHEHVLPTSVPNAVILKGNNNPTYQNPNRHHNGGAGGGGNNYHRHNGNSTPAPSVHNLLKNGQQSPTKPMQTADMPSYSPPSRGSIFTRPSPPDTQYSFYDKPTLRGTNSDSGNINTNTYINRRPLPPPSLTPSAERIPIRPPAGGVVGGGGGGNILVESPPQPPPQYKPPPHVVQQQQQQKAVLNTPAQPKHATADAMPPASPQDGANASEPIVNSNLDFPGFQRILSGSNGRKEDIPEVLLRTVTARPNFLPPLGGDSSKRNNKDETAAAATDDLNEDEIDEDDIDDSGADDEDDAIASKLDERNQQNGGGGGGSDDLFDSQQTMDEPKTQPKQIGQKSTQSPYNNHDKDLVYSTQIIQNLANQHLSTQQQQQQQHNQQKIQSTTASIATSQGGGGGSSKQSINGAAIGGGGGSSTAATWTVAWNIHVYLSAILFTVLAVYSIFKMIFYDKLTHLFNQSYFICIHLILIVICLARIFFLCYDAYNIHGSFHLFISELLLNLPATFLTISFSILILFLLIRSLTHKNNRYSALMRPLTVVVGSSVHVCLCITLHYVESNGQQSQQQQQFMKRGAAVVGGGISGGLYHQQQQHHAHHHTQPPHAMPPRVLSLICQIIYIFVCLSLGLFYLYIYRVLKRVLRNKSQNYIHGYQNLSYAIHITIATALLFILLAAVQIYGAISISTTRPLISSATDVDWLQCGYQFSLRLIEIAIITLISWVTGLKTGASKVLSREKGMVEQRHNVSGFALFPCTSSSSQEHFETDYPAICNANTNLHTYTLRTGKPIYDDNFALNSLGMVAAADSAAPAGVATNKTACAGTLNQLPNSNEFTRTYETNSVRSSSGAAANSTGHLHHLHANHHHHHPQQQPPHQSDGEYLNDSGTMPDHYENPDFELRSTASAAAAADNLDNCYSEPLNGCSSSNSNIVANELAGYDFQNFEKPSFGERQVPQPAVAATAIVPTAATHHHSTEFRASKNLKALKSSNSNTLTHQLDRQHYENPERRSSNSTHSSYGGGVGTNGQQIMARGQFNNLNYNSHNNNSFERRGLRKSGTLNNIGSVHGRGGGGGSSSSSSTNSSAAGIIQGRASGVQTLSSRGGNCQPSPDTLMQRNVMGRTSQQQHQHKKDRHRSSIERSSTSHLNDEQAYGGGSIGRQQPPPQQHFDTISNASSDGICSTSSGSGAGRTAAAAAAMPTMNYQSGAAGANHFKQQSLRHNIIVAADGSSGGESANSGSMLVAEHGFVRFRALDDIGMMQKQQQQQQQQHPSASFRTTGRSKERAYTNS